MIINKKWWMAIAYTTILFIGFIYFDINNNKILKQLDETQKHLNYTQEILTVYQEKYNNLNSVCDDLNKDLENANITIESLKGDKYIVDATVTDKEIDMIAKTVWGEARGCDKLQQSAVVWCILNRVDAGSGTIAQVITAPGQFHGYYKSSPVEDEIRSLVVDVVTRWKIEKAIGGNVGRTLPAEYVFFSSNRYGTSNVFRDKFDGDYKVWDWNCWNPYE